MKKLVSLLVVLAVALAVCPLAMAESAFPTWSNGLSPQQPYQGVAPVDLTTKLGYMVLSPLNGSKNEAGVSSLSIYLPRTDVQPGTGSLKVFAADGKKPIETIAFSDVDHVTAQPITAEDLKWLYWESGVCFSIQLTQALPVDGSYYVTLDADCIQGTNNKVSNPEMTKKDSWAFTTVADYGVVSVERPDNMTVGGAAKVTVKLGGAAVSATIVGSSDVDFDFAPESVEQSGELTVTFTAEGKAKWGVAFVDAQGNSLATYCYITDVSAAAVQP